MEKNIETGMEVRFVGGNGSHFIPLLNPFEAIGKFSVRAPTMTAPEAQGNISVAVIKTVNGFIPGFNVDGYQFKVAMHTEATDTAGSLKQFEQFLLKLTQHLQYGDSDVEKGFDHYGSLALPCVWPPVNNSDDTSNVDENTHSQSLEHGTELFPVTEEGLELPREPEFLQAHINGNLDLPELTLFVKGAYQMRFDLKELDVPANAIQVMAHYEKYHVMGVPTLHPEFAVRMMYYGNKTFSQCCLWWHHEKFPNVKNAISVHALQFKVPTHGFHTKLDYVYTVFEQEHGGFPGPVCKLCPNEKHPAIFCARYPTLSTRQTALRFNHCCIGCGSKDCLIKGYDHKKGPLCDLCGSHCHVDWLCDKEYFQAKIAATVHMILLVYYATKDWSRLEFSFLWKHLENKKAPVSLPSHTEEARVPSKYFP